MTVHLHLRSGFQVVILNVKIGAIRADDSYICVVLVFEVQLGFGDRSVSFGLSFGRHG
jgi:hypothetical protein